MEDNTQKLDQEGTEGAGSQGTDPEVEAEATRNGWLPKESFKGRESDWVDAETFVKQGRILRPILKKNNEKLQKELNEARSELEELKLTTREFATEFAKMRENAYKRAINDLKAQRREAREKEDFETLDEIEERIDALKEEQATRAKTPGKETIKEPSKPNMALFNEWHRDNPWYDEAKEPDLFDAAEAIALRLSRNEPETLGTRAFMDRVTELVKAKFPDKFENPKRKSSPHEGGGQRGESKAKSYSHLPPEAKQACDRFVKQGIMTREQYVDSYEWE
jgi:hypothetical protein